MSTIPGIHSFTYLQQSPRVFDAANGLVETGLWECTKCGKRNPKNKEWYDTCVPDAPSDPEGQAALLDETYDALPYLTLLNETYNAVQFPTQSRTPECLPADSNAPSGGEKGAREGTPTAPDRPSRFPTREVAGNIKAPPEVAPVTGGVKLDQGKARWDLLPCDALDAVAEVLTFGAKKYTQYGECTCNAATAEKTDYTLSNDAAVATRNDSGTSTLNTLGANALTPPNGQSNFQRQNEKATKRQTNEGGPELTDSAYPNTAPSSREDARSVAKPLNSASTTTTRPDKFGAVSASRAMSDSGGLRNQAGSRVHSSTCATRTIVRTGERNWELGMNWGRLQGALMRHVAAWAQGRDIDEESGKLHLAHAATCALMLLALTQREVGKDDRGDTCLT